MKFLVLILTSTSFGFASPFSDLKITTINMWGVPTQREMTAARCEALGRAVSNINYDLVFAQEVFSPGMRTTIKEHSDQRFKAVYVKPKTLKLSHGLFNLSKIKVTKVDFRSFVNCAGVQCLAKKGIQYMQVELANGRRIDTFNTHLQAFSNGKSIRREQIQTLKSFIRQKNRGQYPIVLTGDFNISGNRSEYDVLMKELSRFTDTFRAYRPESDGATWSPEGNEWIEGSSSGHRFDYIFVRDGLTDSWEIKNLYVEFKEKLLWGRSNYVHVSDHYGVGAQLRLWHN